MQGVTRFLCVGSDFVQELGDVNSLRFGTVRKGAYGAGSVHGANE